MMLPMHVPEEFSINIIIKIESHKYLTFFFRNGISREMTHIGQFTFVKFTQPLKARPMTYKKKAPTKCFRIFTVNVIQVKLNDKEC